MTDYENRNFVIFSSIELEKVKFYEVLETSMDTVRKSVDGSKTFVKWDGDNIPESIQSLTAIEGYYNYEEMLDILATEEWTSNEELI